jgi:hypothetical protein
MSNLAGVEEEGWVTQVVVVVVVVVVVEVWIISDI